MKLHIFYRHYNIAGTSNTRPNWFSYEKCYQNLLQTSKYHPDIKINVVYDGNQPNWIDNMDYDSVNHIQAGNDTLSFFKTCNIIKQDTLIQPTDLIYFLENDYMHINGWVEKIFELFSTYSGLDYVSLYDHNDKYILPMYDTLVSKIITTNTHHWRTTPSTCGSFIVTKERFDQDFDILSTMEGDHNKWLWLNEFRSRFILTPLPGLSTHCMPGLLSPAIKWDEL